MIRPAFSLLCERLMWILLMIWDILFIVSPNGSGTTTLSSSINTGYRIKE